MSYFSLLVCSQGDFTVIVDLVKGRHEYKFFVDGQWRHDTNEVRHTWGEGRRGGRTRSIGSNCSSDMPPHRDANQQVGSVHVSMLPVCSNFININRKLKEVLSDPLNL